MNFGKSEMKASDVVFTPKHGQHRLIGAVKAGNSPVYPAKQKQQPQE